MLQYGVRLTTDTSGFVTPLKDAQAQLGKLGGAAQQAGTAAGPAFEKMRRDVEGLAGAFGNLSKIGNIATGLFGITAAAAPAVAAIKSLFEATVQLDKLRLGFTAVSGSATAAGGEIEYVRAVANRLGVDLNSTATAYLKLAASARGTSLEGAQTRDIFEAVSNAVTKLGGSSEETSGALLAISQMISKGTVASEELRGQLAERLPGAFKLAAEAMGVTQAELSKMLEQGQIMASDFLPKFAAALQKAYGGGEMHTAQAELSRLGNAWDQFKQSIADSGLGTLMAAALREMTDEIRNATEVVDEMTRLGKLSGEHFATGFLGAAGIALKLVAQLPGMAPLGAPGFLAGRASEVLQRDQRAYANEFVPGPTEDDVQAGLNRVAEWAKKVWEEANVPAKAYLDTVRDLAGVSKDFAPKLQALYNEFQRRERLNDPAALGDYRKEVARLLQEETDVGKAWKKGSNKPQDNTASALMKAKVETQRAEAEASFATLRDSLEREARLLEQAYAARLMTEEDYFARRDEIRTREAEANIARLRAEAAEQESLIAALQEKRAKSKTPKERNRVDTEIEQARAKLIKTTADLGAAEAKLGDIATDAAARRVAAEKKANDEMVKAVAVAAEFNKSLAETADDLKFEAEMLGKTAVQQRIMTEQRRIDLEVRRQLAEFDKTAPGEDATVQQVQGWLNLRQSIVDAGEAAKATAATQITAIYSTNSTLAGQVDIWRTIEGTAHDAFNSIFQDGKLSFDKLGEVLKRGLLALLYQMTVQRWTLSLAASMSGAGVAQAAVPGAVGNLAGDMVGSTATSAIGNWASSALFGNAWGAATTAYTGSLNATGAILAGMETSGAYSAAAAAATANGATGTALAAGLEAGLAAIPVAGWVALAALVIYGIASGMEDGAAQRTGVFANGAASQGGNPLFAGSSAFGSFGIVNDQWFSNDAGFAGAIKDILTSVASLDDAVAAIVGRDTTATITAALAAQRTDVGFGMEDQNLDEVRGMSATQIITARYKVVLNTIEAGLGDLIDNFEGTGAELAQFVIGLVSLHQITAKLPAAIRDGLNRSLDGTAKSLATATKWATAYAAVVDIANLDPRDVARDRIRANASPETFAFEHNSEALQTLIDDFDGTADSATELANGLGILEGSLIDLVTAAENARQSIADVFSDVARSIQLDTMTPEQQQQFYRDDNTRLMGLIQTANDPNAIARWGQQIASNYTASWNLLPEDARAAQAPGYLSNLSSTQAIIDQRLLDVEQAAENATNAMIDKVRGLLTDAITDLQNVATDMQTAADTQLAAATTPIQVEVTVVQTPEPLVNGG